MHKFCFGLQQTFYMIDDIIKNRSYKKYEVPSGLWFTEITKVQSGNASYDCFTCGNQEQSYIQYTVEMARSSFVWYTFNYVLSIIVFQVMVVLTVCLPRNQDVDAPSFGLTCILTLSVYLTFLFTQLPATGPPGMGKVTFLYLARVLHNMSRLLIFMAMSVVCPETN